MTIGKEGKKLTVLTVTFDCFCQKWVTLGGRRLDVYVGVQLIRLANLRNRRHGFPPLRLPDSQPPSNASRLWLRLEAAQASKGITRLIPSLPSSHLGSGGGVASHTDRTEGDTTASVTEKEPS